MDRIQSLAENNLVTRIKTLRRGLDELKATSQTMGSTSVVLQRVVTGSTSDFHVHAAYNVINGWQITYTGKTQGIPSTGFLWHVFYNGFNATGTGQQVTYTEQVSYTDNVWVLRFWVVGSSPSATLDYDVRVVIYAMAQGTISISQIQ